MPEYELISHESQEYLTFIVNLIYRTPHMHSDYEFFLVLNGNIQIILEDKTITLHEGDIFIINPFQRHELISSSSTLLVLQISSQLTRHFFQGFDRIWFDHQLISPTDTHYKEIFNNLTNISSADFEEKSFYTIKTVGTICALLYDLLTMFPYHINTKQGLAKRQSNANRMNDIINYIESHYTETLFLSDIAKQKNVTTSYLSHFFKSNTGMSFQAYLSKLRCEKARKLLIMTDLSLLDISMSCGFSDPKYFNAGFKKQFGVLPRDYRKNFKNSPLIQQQDSILSTQQFLSKESGIVILSRCIKKLIQKGIIPQNIVDPYFLEE